MEYGIGLDVNECGPNIDWVLLLDYMCILNKLYKR